MFDLKRAETELVKFVQRKAFPYLFSGTNGDQISSQCPQYMEKLRPFIFEGVFRVGGRLAKAEISCDAKHPIILPQHSHLTELIIRQYHEAVGHSGTGHTWAEIRLRFWIIKGGAAVRHSIGKCELCKKRNAKLGKQLMADLSALRLQVDKPSFYHVGVDYFGPFEIKQARKFVKRFCCVFTCLTTRAIHIEVLHDLTTDSFLCALRRFISRRGRPQDVYSDNGTNFVGAARVLRKSLAAWNQL